MSIENFTKDQLDIYQKVRSIEDQLKEVCDPSVFVLNSEAYALLKELNTIQDTCKHVFEDGFCVICGRMEE